MASPFVSRLGTNYCPSDDEVLEIKALLVQPTLQLKALDDELTKLRQAIDKLGEERSRVAAYVDAHEALISPVRRLPLDNPRAVRRLPSYPSKLCYERFRGTSTPRTHMQLHVVEPLPSLTDPTPTSFEEKIARRLEITQTWLGRSGQCPLSISLQSAPEGISQTGSPAPSVTSIKFMETLLSFAPRWQHIKFTAPLSLVLETLSHFDAEVPHLETVAFHDQGHHRLSTTLGPFNLLRGARISSLSIPVAIFLPESLPLRWSQLTTLTVGGHKWSVPLTMTSDALLRVIAKCPELRCCKLMVHDSDMGEPIQISEHHIVELPSLHTLAIHCVARAAPAVSNLLIRLSLPELRNFTIFGSTQDAPALGSFSARLVRLETLRIDTNTFSQASLLETFRSLPPSIRRLRISDIDHPWGQQTQTCFDEMLAALTTSPDLCPMLQHFSVDYGFNLSDRAVLLFIAARMQESRPALNRVDINFGRQVVVDIMPDLQAFIEMGLAVSLVYLPLQSSQDSPWVGLANAPSVNSSPWVRTHLPARALIVIHCAERHMSVSALLQTFMASPFVSRLGTNYCPSDDEVFEIKALLVEPTLQLKGLDDEITKLQQAINKLGEERSRVAAYVDAHKALISPVRRLPLDIIQELFFACLPIHRNCVISASEAPVLLGRICSSWRAISLSSPRLWSSLHVVEPLPCLNTASYDLKAAQRLEVTQTWLGRSGQCPLSISLQSAPQFTPETGSPDLSPNSIQFIQTLVSFVSRWQHIHFTTPFSLLLEVISYLHIDVPRLETVTLHHHGDQSLLHPWGPFDILRGARISSFSFPAGIFMPENLPLQWNQLTTLMVDGPTWTTPLTMSSDTLLRVISGCTELRCCKLMVHDPDVAIPISEHPIVELPFLHTLAIHCVARVAPAVSVLLMRLSLPELRNFTIFGSAQDTATLRNFIATLLQLEDLHIEINILSEASLLEAFHALPPSLRRIQICDIQNSWGSPQTCLDQILAILTISPGLCPVLQHLSIEQGFSLSDRAVLSFISSRMQTSRPTLNHVHIDFRRQIVVDIMPDLQGFIQRGLAVSLVYLPDPFSQNSPWLGLPDAPPVNWTSLVPPPSMSQW
ncbi:hypothetical protein C8R45DRAFT_1082129 [Mycena sanguinolenta]|nr:hypothetical protein C8R45DRAFT_1082129 [Mycena sanguinolenta]